MHLCRMNEGLFELQERSMGVGNWHYLILALSFLLLAITRLSQHSILFNLGGLFVRSASIRVFAKENNALNPASWIALSLNYILTTTYFMFLVVSNELPSFKAYTPEWFLLLFLPLAYPIFNIFNQSLAAWLIGEEVLVKESLLIEFTTAHIIGFIYSFLLLFYLLDPNYYLEIRNIALGVLLALFLWRIIRSMFAVYKRGGLWYYIILYLCTLEILPLVVVYYTFR